MVGIVSGLLLLGSALIFSSCSNKVNGKKEEGVEKPESSKDIPAPDTKPAPSLPPAYSYAGVCAEYAHYGRIKAADFEGEAEGKEVMKIDISAPQVFYYGADRDTDNDPKKEADTSNFELSRPLKYKGVEALHLSGVPAAKDHPSVNPAEPNPYVGGLGIGFDKLPADLTQASHVLLKVFPRTPANLVLEIYENDGGDPYSIDKVPANFWLPGKDDDFFKTVIKLEPTGKWQALSIPLAKFVDWNKKIKCPTPIQGINEDVGNNILDPKKDEALAFQLTFVSNSWKLEPKDIYVGKEIRFIKSLEK